MLADFANEIKNQMNFQQLTKNFSSHCIRESNANNHQF